MTPEASVVCQPTISLLSTDVPGVPITGERRGHGRLVYRDLLTPTLPHNRPWSCLDVGSGNGYLLSLLAREAQLVLALEPDRTNEPSLHENLRELSRLTVEYTTLEEATLSRYSYVLACHSLYNVKDCGFVCAKLCDATDDGGRIVVVHHITGGSYDAICAAALDAEGRPFSDAPYRATDLANSLRARPDGSFKLYRAELALWLGSIDQATDSLAKQLRCQTPKAHAAIATALERHADWTRGPDDIFLTCVDAVLVFDRRLAAQT